MRNLIAEMARYGVTNLDIKNLLNCSDRTVTNKLSGETEFSISEATKIRDTYFMGYRLEYLFAPDVSMSELFSHDVTV